MSLLTVKKLSKNINNRNIIKDIDFSINSSEIVGLLGPNGAGKTTTFYSIAGLIQPSYGKVFLNGKNITKMPMHLRSKYGISYLPQESSIFQNLTVEDNILGLAQLSSIHGDALKDKYNKIIKDFNLNNILSQKGRELSGGQRRRVEIARCLVTMPQIILMDEPFAGIDPLVISEIKDLIKNLKTKGIGILISDHNVKATLDICDQIYVINVGEIIASGSPDEIIKNDLVKKVYLGDVYS